MRRVLSAGLLVLLIAVPIVSAAGVSFTEVDLEASGGSEGTPILCVHWRYGGALIWIGYYRQCNV